MPRTAVSILSPSALLVLLLASPVGAADQDLLGRLPKLLDAHRRWLQSDHRDGEQVNLDGANLSEASLFRANLRDSSLIGADLGDASLGGADLSHASLIGADLSNASLVGADLSDASLYGANLSGADLGKADLTGADLDRAHLTRADLGEALLSEASLVGADLSDASLYGANLSGANLRKADLTGADLLNADLSGADFRATKLAGALFEPTSLPHPGKISGMSGLSAIGIPSEPTAAVLLRAELRKSGLRDLERETTYAIERFRTRHENSGLWRLVRLVFFEWTVQYGLEPSGAIRKLAWLALICMLLYMPAVDPPPGSSETGIWQVLPQERVIHRPDEAERRRIIAGSFPAIIGWAAYFSLLSAFHIGWRDLNVGTWLSRVQPREFALRATGWVRVVSGLQSVLGVYLLALWFSSEFLRPFG
jgi:uncharacterized protein YjbI with pentapeptide repeats